MSDLYQSLNRKVLAAKALEERAKNEAEKEAARVAQASQVVSPDEALIVKLRQMGAVIDEQQDFVLKAIARGIAVKGVEITIETVKREILRTAMTAEREKNRLGAWELYARLSNMIQLGAQQSVQPVQPEFGEETKSEAGPRLAETA